MDKLFATVRAGVFSVAGAILLLAVSPVRAQDAGAPLVLSPTNSGSTDALSNAPPARGSVAGERPMGVPLHPLPQQGGNPGGQHASDQALQNNVGKHLNPEPGPLFEGIGQTGYIPPDTNIAVGPNHIVEVVNSEIAVFDKTGAMKSGYPKLLGSLWTKLGGGCWLNNSGDPVVQYDRAADRWLVTQLGSLRSPYSECIAVSQTGDPTGAYFTWSYSFGTSLNDYPKFGVWPTANNGAYLATFNMFANGQNFTGAELCAFDRSAMLAGAASPKAVCFLTQEAGVLPSDVDGATTPGASEPGYFLDFDGTSPGITPSLRLFQFAPNFATPANSTLTGPMVLTANVDPFEMACDGGTCIPQPGTSVQLDSLGDRLMYRLAWRQFSDGHESMVVNHSVVAGASVGVRWYELDAASAGAPFAVTQHGTFAPDSSYRWMGSAAMDKLGDIAIGYSLSSSTVYPSIYLTGRAPGDPDNTLGAETQLMAGHGSQTGYTRWGDYTALRIDPADDCKFWYANEYYPVSASYNWHTYIGSFNFPNCLPTPDFSMTENPSSMTIAAGGSNNGGATITVSSLNGFGQQVNLTNDCVAPLTCTFGSNALTPGASPASTSLTVSVAPGQGAGSFTQTITATSADNTIVHKTTFTVTVPPPPPPDFSIAFAAGSSSTMTVTRGSKGTEKFTLTSAGSSSVTFSTTGLPSRTSATFSPNPANENGGSTTMTVSVNSRAARGTYHFTVNASNGTYQHPVAMTLTIQ